VLTAADATLLAGMVASILRFFRGTIKLQLGQFGNNCGIDGIYKIYIRKDYKIIRL
jgi:hypothetical protein